MKKIVISTIILVVTVTYTFAQNTSNFGVKAGYNLASVTDDSGNETDARSGFHVGLYSENFISENFSIQPEVMYSQQGFKIENNNSTYTLERDYINIPVMFKGYLAKTFFIEAGPQVGFAVSKKETLDTVIGDFENDSEPNSFDWGLNVGTGIKVNAATIGLRYHFGMGDLYEDTDFKNRVFQISVGFDF